MRPRIKRNYVVSATGNSVKNVKSFDVRYPELKKFHEEFIKTHEVLKVELTDLQRFELELKCRKLELDSKAKEYQYAFPNDSELCAFEDKVRSWFNK